MEIRSQSKTGQFVPPLAEIPAKLSQQLDAVKQQWLDQLNRDPASFARDAAILAAAGFRPGPITPIDQFLWSSHIELVAGFRRTGA